MAMDPSFQESTWSSPLKQLAPRSKGEGGGGEGGRKKKKGGGWGGDTRREGTEVEEEGKDHGVRELGRGERGGGGVGSWRAQEMRKCRGVL